MRHVDSIWAERVSLEFLDKWRTKQHVLVSEALFCTIRPKIVCQCTTVKVRHSGGESVGCVIDKQTEAEIPER